MRFKPLTILVALRWTFSKHSMSFTKYGTEGDHQDVLVIRGWRLSRKTWNPITSPWMKRLMWLRIVHSGYWCLRLALHTPSGACQRRRRYCSGKEIFVSQTHSISISMVCHSVRAEAETATTVYLLTHHAESGTRAVLYLHQSF